MGELDFIMHVYMHTCMQARAKSTDKDGVN